MINADEYCLMCRNREVLAYYADKEWVKGFISRENFTDFERLGADEWAKEDLWDEDSFW